MFNRKTKKPFIKSLAQMMAEGNIKTTIGFKPMIFDECDNVKWPNLYPAPKPITQRDMQDFREEYLEDWDAEELDDMLKCVDETEDKVNALMKYLKLEYVEETVIMHNTAKKTSQFMRKATT